MAGWKEVEMFEIIKYTLKGLLFVVPIMLASVASVYLLTLLPVPWNLVVVLTPPVLFASYTIGHSRRP